MTLRADTPLFAIVAHPIAHLHAPELFNAFLAERGVAGVMVALDIAPENLAGAMSTLRKLRNLKGFCVSNPHKQTIVPMLDRLTEQAQLTGAVNLVRRDPDGALTGAQGDGDGFIAGLVTAGRPVAGRRVFMAGAGGVATGIGFAAAAHGAAALAIHNRTPERAVALAHRIGAAYPHCLVSVAGPDPSGYDVVINATSAGLSPDDPPPFAFGGLRAPMVAAEVIMKPKETRFLKVAASRGCQIQYGEVMAQAQMMRIATFVRVL